MQFPADLKYTRDHEWVRVSGNEAIIGITEFAQSELGDIVFVDLPAAGKALRQKETLCVVESTKAASDVYAPISGNVKEVNAGLAASPDLVNKSPYGDGWMVKLTVANSAEIESLMSAAEYSSFIEKK